MDIRLHILPQRGLGRSEKLAKIARRVKRGKLRMRLPQSCGDAPGGVQILLLGVQLLQTRIERVAQHERSCRKRFDRVNAQAERPQQLHAQQHLCIGLRIFPVAVLRPLGCDQPLRFIIPDVGPRQSRQCFDLLDRHMHPSCPQRTVSSRFTVKLFLIFFVDSAGISPLRRSV